jgi:hypothetical protein
MIVYNAQNHGFYGFRPSSGILYKTQLLRTGSVKFARK